LVAAMAVAVGLVAVDWAGDWVEDSAAVGLAGWVEDSAATVATAVAAAAKGR